MNIKNMINSTVEIDYKRCDNTIKLKGLLVQQIYNTFPGYKIKNNYILLTESGKEILIFLEQIDTIKPYTPSSKISDLFNLYLENYNRKIEYAKLYPEIEDEHKKIIELILNENKLISRDTLYTKIKEGLANRKIPFEFKSANIFESYIYLKDYSFSIVSNNNDEISGIHLTKENKKYKGFNNINFKNKISKIDNLIESISELENLHCYSFDTPVYLHQVNLIFKNKLTYSLESVEIILDILQNLFV